MGHLQFLEKYWVSVKEIRVATMKYGYTWTSSAIDTLTDHERTMIIVHISRKSLAPTRLPKKKVGTTMEVTIHFHLYRQHENLSFHKQQIRRVENNMHQDILVSFCL